MIRNFFLLIILFFLISCGGWDSFESAVSGQKKATTDEYLIKKKDPLILPPDYENLPTPDDQTSASEEISIFEKSLENAVEENPSGSNSVEDSILKKIRSK